MFIQSLTSMFLLVGSIMNSNCQNVLNVKGTKLKTVNSLSIPYQERNFTNVFINTGLSNAAQCYFYGLSMSESSVLAIVYTDNNNNCSVIVASTVGNHNNIADQSYFSGSIFVNDEYSKVMAVYKSPSSCLAPVSVSSTFNLIQQRVDGCLLFNKTWTEYVNEFGHPTGNYWAGLEQIHLLTLSGPKRVRFEMKKFLNDTIYVAEYSSFKVEPASDKYRVYISGYDSSVSTVADGLTVSSQSATVMDNQRFSTFDQENDNHGSLFCSNEHGGSAWWYNGCTFTNPNGFYRYDRVGDNSNIYWWQFDLNNPIESFKIMLYN